MSDQNNNSNNSGPTKGNKPYSSQPRIGRIGQWGASSGASSGNSSRSGSGPRFATLGDLGSSGGRPEPAAHPGDSDNEGEGDGREGQTWFTGGERSGLSVQNPNHRGDGPDASGAELVRSLLQKAADAGLPSSASAGPAPRSAFSGSGHTLGSDDVESQLVPDPNAASEQPPTEERTTRHISFWRNGFSVEDGPLLGYNDPANAEILRSIDQGQAPADLLHVRYGQPVELRVARRMHEDYIPPQPRPRQAFEGSGNRLGAPTPTFPTQGLSSGIVSVSATATTTAPVHVPTVPREDRESLQTKYEVDDTQETTTVAIQLADGTRMRMRMNLTSTVRDIRNIINAARPENLTRSYTIQTMRPTRILGEDTQTIQDAGLQRSLVVQRWDD